MEGIYLRILPSSFPRGWCTACASHKAYTSTRTRRRSHDAHCSFTLLSLPVNLTLGQQWAYNSRGKLHSGEASQLRRGHSTAQVSPGILRCSSEEQIIASSLACGCKSASTRIERLRHSAEFDLSPWLFFPRRRSKSTTYRQDEAEHRAPPLAMRSLSFDS
jgi:hypothetical protein